MEPQLSKCSWTSFFEHLYSIFFTNTLCLSASFSCTISSFYSSWSSAYSIDLGGISSLSSLDSSSFFSIWTGEIASFSSYLLISDFPEALFSSDFCFSEFSSMISSKLGVKQVRKWLYFLEKRILATISLSFLKWGDLGFLFLPFWALDFKILNFLLNRKIDFYLFIKLKF